MSTTDNFRNADADPPANRAAAGWAAAWFFCVLAAYYAIRPVRETFGVSEGIARLPKLFTWTLAALLAASPLYGWAVARTPRRALPLAIYGFFIVNLLAFWYGFGQIDLQAQDAAASAWRSGFYVWVSVFNLFAVTLVWSAAVECFTGEQGKRVFGLLAGAGTLGGLCGSRLAVLVLNRTHEPRDVLLLSAAFLGGAIAASWRFRRSFAASPNLGAEDISASRSAWSELQAAIQGMCDVGRSRYLALLALLMVLSSVAGTGIYMQMSYLVGEQIADPAARAAWYARINDYQNVLTLFGQTIGASWAMRKCGLAATLAVTPAVYAAGFTAIACRPSLLVHGVVDVAQRVASFAAGVPAREVLFTAVAPDEKYRAKAFIDTVGKRTGDAVAAHLFAALLAVGWKVTSIAWAMVPLAALIAAASLLAAREYQTRRSSD